MSDSKFEKIPLEWVRVFEAAGRTGSFTSAAQEIGLTQAAVSQRIRNLEDRLGTQLFSRQARGVTLTIDGEAWLPSVSSALQALGRSTEELFGTPLKKVMISASASVTQLWIAPRLALLNTQGTYQVSMTTMNIEPDFTKANATIEIRYGNGNWPDLLAAQLYRERLTPLASPDILNAKLPWQDLPRIAVSGPRAGWQDWAEQSGETAPIPKYRFDSFVSAQAAAMAGAGVILGSLPLCEAALASGKLVRLTDNTLPQEAGYWMTAKPTKLSRRQWVDLVNRLTD
jgi:LysR family glycine cleavage system transcriptional activator